MKKIGQNSTTQEVSWFFSRRFFFFFDRTDFVTLFLALQSHPPPKPHTLSKPLTMLFNLPTTTAQKNSPKRFRPVSILKITKEPSHSFLTESQEWLWRTCHKMSADQSLWTTGLKHNICKGIVSKKAPTSSGCILDYTPVLSDLDHPPFFSPWNFCNCPSASPIHLFLMPFLLLVII